MLDQTFLHNICIVTSTIFHNTVYSYLIFLIDDVESHCIDSCFHIFLKLLLRNNSVCFSKLMWKSNSNSRVHMQLYCHQFACCHAFPVARIRSDWLELVFERSCLSTSSRIYCRNKLQLFSCLILLYVSKSRSSVF